MIDWAIVYFIIGVILFVPLCSIVNDYSWFKKLSRPIRIISRLVLFLLWPIPYLVIMLGVIFGLLRFVYNVVTE